MKSVRGGGNAHNRPKDDCSLNLGGGGERKRLSVDILCVVLRQVYLKRVAEGVNGARTLGSCNTQTYTHDYRPHCLRGSVCASE